MGERFYRAQLLMQPDLHRRLRQIARREGRSISDVSRDLLEYALNQREKERTARLERVRALRRVAEQIQLELGEKRIDLDVVELIQEEREERLRELGRH
jgi:plasmid stability protein